MERIPQMVGETSAGACSEEAGVDTRASIPGCSLEYGDLRLNPGDQVRYLG